MTAIILEALLWGAKTFFEIRDKKKLTDKEFVEYVLAHQKKRANAGKSATNWEDSLQQAKAELAAEIEAEKKAEEESQA